MTAATKHPLWEVVDESDALRVVELCKGMGLEEMEYVL